MRLPEYREAYAAVSTPQAGESGEPLDRLLTLTNPPPQPSPIDVSLAFTVQAQTALSAKSNAWIGAIHIGQDAHPVVVTSDGSRVQLSNGTAWAAPARGPRDTAPATPGRHGVLAADLNYDFLVDLAVFGARGLELLRQRPDGTFTSVTADSKLPDVGSHRRMLPGSGARTSIPTATWTSSRRLPRIRRVSCATTATAPSPCSSRSRARRVCGILCGPIWTAMACPTQRCSTTAGATPRLRERPRRELPRTPGAGGVSQGSGRRRGRGQRRCRVRFARAYVERNGGVAVTARGPERVDDERIRAHRRRPG